MESINAILKKEEVNVNTYQTFEEAKMVIFEFIESWIGYNKLDKKEKEEVKKWKVTEEKKDSIRKNLKHRL